MIRLADIERAYDPAVGSLGRGDLVTREEFDSIDATGYKPFRGGEVFPVRDSDGSVTARLWRAWTREAEGKHFVVALQCVQL